jgi:hypothetical protein
MKRLDGKSEFMLIVIWLSTVVVGVVAAMVGMVG